MEKKDILKAIKNYLGFTKEKEFAEYLEVAPSVLSTWYARNTFDIDIIMKKCPFLNGNWVINGDGEMLKGGEIRNEIRGEFESQLERKQDLELQKEIAFQKAIIELQQKLIASLEETKKEMESRLREINEKNKKQF